MSILTYTDIRLFYRHKRLISERSHLKAEEQLYQEQMHSSGKPAKASLIGQIGIVLLLQERETNQKFQ